MMVSNGLLESNPSERRSFFQLAGHQETFRFGTKPETILKRSLGNEEQCLTKLMNDNSLRDYVPKFYGVVRLKEDGCSYLEMQDLLYRFNLSNVSVMDVKMGCRTYHEEELSNALRETKLRPDMYKKMIEVDENEPTQEENYLKAITKPRYMIWRENLSSTANLAFRIEAMRLQDGSVDKDFKTTKSEDQLAKTFMRFATSRKIKLAYLKRLYDLREALIKSHFFRDHELIGCSLLLVHDDENASIWLIDFAKTQTLPETLSITHWKKWEVGNHEDGFLTGINNLIRLFESITLVRMSI